MHELFARCASGFEAVLADELRSLGLQRVRPLKGGVSFAGSTHDAYRACLWSRVATRIQLVLARVGANDAQALYDGVRSVAWDEHVSPGATIAVHAHGQNAALRNTQFTALKVKDAVCDRLRDVRGARPDVDAANPGFAIDVSLHKDKATIYANLSGASLHRRGYREDGVQTQAPLKETLAAGMLLAAGWPDLVARAQQSQDAVGFLDPMCGSGTLAIEAALVAAGIAPGLHRAKWGFEGWVQHDAAAWAALLDEAGERRNGTDASRVRIVAGDIDQGAVDIARANAQRAGVSGLVELHCAESAQAQAYLGALATLPQQGLMAVNPPYGQRLNAPGGSAQVNAALAGALDAVPESWGLCAITPDAALDTVVGSAPAACIECFNGPLAVTVRLYAGGGQQRQVLPIVSLAGAEHEVRVAEANSAQFAARLRKAARERAKWARREGVACYRIYDADLPDYSFAIDMLEGAGPNAGQRFACLYEYQAPSSVDPARAERRRNDCLAIVPLVLDVPSSQVFAKMRRQAKGGGQYREAQGDPFVVHVQEDGYLFELDLNGHLDTGLFLDHRTTRQVLGQMAQGRGGAAGEERGARFLNLFAYTGTATVHAAGGGASATTTVDLSQTYLAWAKRNMAANGFDGKQHAFVHADCLKWLHEAARQGQQFDLVFCDPPTFSNSKAMDASSFDVQRDHVALLRDIAAVLAPEGTIVFSCNRRSFKLDEDALGACGLSVRDITPDTIPHDFSRTPRIHHCYIVTR